MNITVAKFLLKNNVYKDCGMVRIPTVYYDQIMDALKEPETLEKADALKEPKTLEKALKEIMKYARVISYLEQEIDDKFGVRLSLFAVRKDNLHGCRAEFNVRRGIEEIEKALGETAEPRTHSRDIKTLKHYGMEFTAYADDKTKVFVKAFKEPPKVVIVED